MLIIAHFGYLSCWGHFKYSGVFYRSESESYDEKAKGNTRIADWKIFVDEHRREIYETYTSSSSSDSSCCFCLSCILPLWPIQARHGIRFLTVCIPLLICSLIYLYTYTYILFLFVARYMSVHTYIHTYIHKHIRTYIHT